MRPSRTLTFASTSIVGAVAILGSIGCGSADDSRVEVDGPGLEEQGKRQQGKRQQGTMLASDDEIVSFRLSSLVAGGATADKAVVVEGTLQAFVTDPPAYSPSLVDCAATTYGPWRACGWDYAGKGVCTPGSSVHIGTGYDSACSSACGQDGMIRVCADFPCEPSGFLGQNDDTCGLCPFVMFTCPPSGRYVALTAPYVSSSGAPSLRLGAHVDGSFPVYDDVLTGDDFVGRTVTADMSDGTTRDYQISAVAPDLDPESLVHPGTNLTYQLERSVGGGTEYLCAPDPTNGIRGAVPFSGRWDTTAHHHADADALTFACHEDGVISKCNNWGYRPYFDVLTPGGWKPGQYTHASCMRMAMADYCGDGPHTKPGTTINAWDNLLPHAQVKDPSGEMTFEAGWTPEGASCLSHLRWDDVPAEVWTCPHLLDANSPNGHKTCDFEQDGPWMDPTVVHLFNESIINKAAAGP